MDVNLTWQEITLRLFCAVIGGILIGINRGEHGRTAGLRTTLLVCLAACIAMIQANLLLGTSGRTPESFARLDFMRLPLGILTGVGFIGAGAILRRGSLVIGVTTAATLWFVTVMGLCFGGGQIVLGLAALALGIFTLWGLKWVENFWKQERHARLTFATGHPDPVENEIVETFRDAGYRFTIISVTYRENGALRELGCRISWRGRIHDQLPPELLKQLMSHFALTRLEWRLVEA